MDAKPATPSSGVVPTADFARRLIDAVNKAITAGAAEAMSRFMRGEAAFGPEVLRATIEHALGDVKLDLNGKPVLTPKARAAMCDALSILAYNAGAALAGKEPA